MSDIIKYKAFIKVVDLGSFTLAAKALGYSQPGIHHMITSLESELGNPLLRNINNRIVPTDFGYSILEYCNEIVRQSELIEHVASLASNETQNRISFSGYHSMLLELIPSIIQKFSSVYSHTSIYISEENWYGCIDSLKARHVDFSFMGDTCPSEFEFIPLLRDPVLVCMPKSHPLASYDSLSPSMLKNCTTLTYEQGSDDIIQAVASKCNFVPLSLLHLAHDSPTFQLIRNNLGIGFISKLETFQMPSDLVVKPFDVDIYRNLGIVINPEVKSYPTITAFIEISREYVRQFCKEKNILCLA